MKLLPFNWRLPKIVELNMLKFERRHFSLLSSIAWIRIWDLPGSQPVYSGICPPHREGEKSNISHRERKSKERERERKKAKEQAKKKSKKKKSGNTKFPCHKLNSFPYKTDNL